MRLFRRVRKALTTDGNGKHCHWSCPTRAEVPETWRKQRQQVLFFSRTHVSRNQKWAFCYISSLFQSARKPLTRLLEAQARRRLFRAHAPSVSAGRSGSDGLFQPARKGAVRKGRQVLSDAHGRGVHQLPPSPPRPSIVSACASCMRSASRVPRSFCRPLALLWAVAELPLLRPSFSGFKEFPPQSPGKSSAGDTPKKQLRESPHAFPLPDGARQPSCSLPARSSVPFRQGKKALFPSSCSRCIKFSTFW